MEEQIRSYIQYAFSAVPPSQKAEELQEELIQNLIERYRAELAAGKNVHEAYGITIAGIGDLTELLESVGAPAAEPEKKAASPEAEAAAPVFEAAAPQQPLELQPEEEQGHSFHGSLGVLWGGYWTLVVAVYLLSSFAFQNWAWSWTIFLFATALQELIKGLLAPKGKKMRHFHGAWWPFVVGAYFVSSFLLEIWAWSWCMFIIGAALDQIVIGIVKIGGNR